MDTEVDLLHGNAKKPPPPRRRRCCSTTAVTLLVFLFTNAVSILVSSGAAPPSLLRRYKPATVRLWDDSASLAADLNATQAALAAGRAELAGLHARVNTANELLRTLLDAMSASAPHQAPPDGAWSWKREPSGELKLAIGPHALGAAGSAPAFAALGHACVRAQDDLERYMAYAPGGECPADEPLARALLLAGCEPLPRRRCRARPPPKGYAHPAPLPGSLWATPLDTSACKNHSCLLRAGAVDGCDACLDLRPGGRERARWGRDDGALSYSLDAVLAARPNGTVRIGLDLGGGGSVSGTLAARMLPRGVTVVTAVADAGAPLDGFVAARGLVPVHVSAAQRLPFFDGTMDLVHAGHARGGWMAPGGGVALEFALFDVYRVLRPGGLLWLDHFACAGEQVNATVAPLLDRVGFRKLRWNTGRGKGKDRWYISALLERPMA
ncbi:hypothetical protein BS78_07G017700 [Paspalum vaginatum]|nr:hypothetical protein BS78_07G017700 [Paspalum vaginatum]